MTYQENFQKWADFADLPDYLRRDLGKHGWKNERRKMPSTQTLNSVLLWYAPDWLVLQTNHVNIYVVRQTAEGLARLIESKGGNEKERGVTQSLDSRHFSQSCFWINMRFAKHGIKSMSLAVTVQLQSFHLQFRHLNCFAGIMITASHNPAPFSSYKVYGEDGGQMPPHGADIDSLHPVLSIIHLQLRLLMLKKLKKHLVWLKSLVCDAEYLKRSQRSALTLPWSSSVKTWRLSTPTSREVLEKCYWLVDMLLRRQDLTLLVVEAQATQTQTFQQFVSNPESQAFALAEELGHQVGADVLVATDPGADRVGIEVPSKRW